MSNKAQSSRAQDDPHFPELGVTSGPLKSAAFFIGAHCKDYNGRPLPRQYFGGRYSPPAL